MTRLNQSRGNNVSHCYFYKSVFLAVALGPSIISGATAFFSLFSGYLPFTIKEWKVPLVLVSSQ